MDDSVQFLVGTRGFSLQQPTQLPIQMPVEGSVSGDENAWA